MSGGLPSVSSWGVWRTRSAGSAPGCTATAWRRGGMRCSTCAMWPASTLNFSSRSALEVRVKGT